LYLPYSPYIQVHRQKLPAEEEDSEISEFSYLSREDEDSPSNSEDDPISIDGTALAKIFADEVGGIQMIPNYISLLLHSLATSNCAIKFHHVYSRPLQ
jgi:hypothetical protein